MKLLAFWPTGRDQIEWLGKIFRGRTKVKDRIVLAFAVGHSEIQCEEIP